MSCLSSSFLTTTATPMNNVSFNARNSVMAGCAVTVPQTSTSKSDKFSFTIEAAHKKGTGSVKNGRDSNPKYRGVKLYGQEKCRAGNIIVRQLGNKFHAGPGVGTGKDFTLFALRDGEILFKKGAGKKQFVCVVDAVDRSAEVSRKTKRRELYTPRSSAAVESR